MTDISLAGLIFLRILFHGLSQLVCVGLEFLGVRLAVLLQDNCTVFVGEQLIESSIHPTLKS